MMRFVLLCLVAVFVIGMGMGGYVLYTALSAPGHENTIDQGKKPEPKPDEPPQPNPPVAGPLESLRQSWNSEDFPDWPVAELLASMSDKSYLSPVDAEDAFRSLGFMEVKTIEYSSMIGYVAWVDEAAVIVFRGTDNDVDWIVNLAISSVQTPKGSIHAGFYNAYQQMQEQIMKIVNKAKSKHLWITGHSLGGALAAVCAYDLTENHKLQIDGIVTFGQPMIAKQPLADYLGNAFRGRFAHFVNRNDIVARVPPTFAHFGSLVWFTDDGIKRSKPSQIMAFGTEEPDEPKNLESTDLTPVSEEEFERLKASLRGGDIQGVAPDAQDYKAELVWIADHGMPEYLEKIHSLRGGVNLPP